MLIPSPWSSNYLFVFVDKAETLSCPLLRLVEQRNSSVSILMVSRGSKATKTEIFLDHTLINVHTC